MNTPNRRPVETVTAADAPEIVAALPCGCQLPFALCPVAEALLCAEWAAGDEMLRVGRAPDVTPDAYAAARAKWRAAVRAYDTHIGRG